MHKIRVECDECIGFTIIWVFLDIFYTEKSSISKAVSGRKLNPVCTIIGVLLRAQK